MRPANFFAGNNTRREIGGRSQADSGQYPVSVLGHLVLIINYSLLLPAITSIPGSLYRVYPSRHQGTQHTASPHALRRFKLASVNSTFSFFRGIRPCQSVAIQTKHRQSLRSISTSSVALSRLQSTPLQVNRSRINKPISLVSTE
jgi:hypothetical protein